MTPQALPATMRVLERGPSSSSNIVFLGGGNAVVDTSYVRHAPQTVALVSHVLAGAPLARIINTHTHSDHMGGNAALARAYPGVRIRIPAGSADVVARWDERAMQLSPLGQECERFGFDATYDAGDTLELGGLEWRALGSPGHYMDSLMLYCASARILITGDALWEDGFGILFPDLTGEVEPGTALAAQRATLAAIAALDIEWVIPGHGAPFTDVAGALQRAASRLEYLAADPLRNARYAAKVALAFVLKVDGRIALADLSPRIGAMSLVQEINRDYFCLAPDALVEYLVGELERSRAARREDGWLIAI